MEDGNMDKTDLDAVLSVDSCSSFSEAAVQTSFSQSSVSKHVASVEKELGLKLFNRKTHSAITRTSYGEALLPDIKACSDALQRLYEHAAAIRQNENTQLKVCSHAGIGTLGEDEMISEFCSFHPDICIEQVVDKYGRPAGKACLDGVDLDFSLLNMDELNELRNDKDLEVVPLRECNLLMLLPKQHKAAQGKTVDLEALRTDAFFFRRIPNDNEDNVYSRFLQLFISACKSEGFTPDIHFVQLRAATVLSMVSAGLGVIPLMNKISALPGNTVLLPISKHYYSAVLTAYCHKRNNSPALRLFLSYLKEHSAFFNRTDS